MTDGRTSAPRYDDEEFLGILDVHAAVGDDWVGTASIATFLGCDMGTVNRRLLDLADAGESIEVYDPEAGDGDLGETVSHESVERPTRRLLGFRRPPEDPENAPEHLVTMAGRLV